MNSSNCLYHFLFALAAAVYSLVPGLTTCQVVQVDGSGNLTAAGSVTAAGFATSGSGTAFLGGNLGSQPTDASCTTTGKGCIWLDSSGVVKQRLNNGTVLILGTLSTNQFWVTSGSSDWTGSNTLGFPSANQMRITGIQLGTNMTAATTKVFYLIGTADNNSGVGHRYDIGIYGPCASGQASCPLAVHLRSTTGIAGSTLGSTGGSAFTTNWNTSSSSTLAAGRYYIAMTTDCASACATLYSNVASGAFSFYSNANYTSTTSGVLSSTITAPTDSLTITKVPDLAIF